MQPETKRTLIPELSHDTETLAACLRTVPVGGTVSYETLSGLIRGNVQQGARHLLDSARRIVQREEQAVFGTIRGVGLKRLTDTDKARTGGASLQRINRTSRRGIQILSCVQDFDKLDLNDKVKHNAYLSILAVFYEVSRPKSVRRIEGAVAVMQKQLPFTDTLRAFLPS